jgi:predicted dehydrogenase
MAEFPLKKKDLKIGILGYTEGNGHPYSWSAMFNGYDREFMERECPFPVISDYLGKQPKETFGIEGAKITHICCTGYECIERARHVAKASLIENVTERPEDMIGEVDAVICATDNGNEHVERCLPFLSAGIPMFIDKPLVNTEEDLKTFIRLRNEGKRFISSSSLRYCKEIEPYYGSTYEFGDLRYICSPMPKRWEEYGIHAVERMYPLLGRGFVSVQNSGSYERDHVHLVHESGCSVDIPQGVGMAGSGMLMIGTRGSAYVEAKDSYYAFKKQLDLFVNWLRTGEEPVDFADTVEMMKIIIAGLRSRKENGRVVYLSEINV